MERAVGRRARGRERAFSARFVFTSPNTLQPAPLATSDWILQGLTLARLSACPPPPGRARAWRGCRTRPLALPCSRKPLRGLAVFARKPPTPRGPAAPAPRQQCEQEAARHPSPRPRRSEPRCAQPLALLSHHQLRRPRVPPTPRGPRRASPTPAVPFPPLPVPQRARARCSSGSPRHPPSAPISHPGSPSDSRPDAPRQASWEDHVDDQGLGGATPSATTSVLALQSPSLPTHCFGPAEWPTPPVLPPTAGGGGGTRVCWLCGNASQQVKSTYAPLRARTPGPGNRNFGAPVAEKVCTLEWPGEKMSTL